ncbi:MAG: sel1 repeat family protein [Magnetococcus sp. XQGC-1]
MARLHIAQRDSKRWVCGTLAAIALGMGVASLPRTGMAVDVEQAYKQGQASYQRNDWVGAIAQLRVAAEAQHVPSMVMLAYVLDRAEEDAEAMQWYRKAAMLNSAEGAMGLGEMLAESAEGKKNPAEALEWITRAAKLGHHPAMFRLAMLHAKGSMGLTLDTKEAQKWLELAAKDGFAPAVQELEKMRKPSVDASPAKAGSKPGPAAQKEVETVVEQWARAWSDKNLSAYRALYSSSVQPLPAFNPPEKMGPMQVKELQVILLEDDKARALFTQQIQVGKESNQQRKALSVHREAGTWKIVKEEAVP